ncbi:CU044_5270 family protein [Actinoplanes sp. G11-F43]|uniref:CU044_5270 family protein n=1 Tax=Actinoplanes sp. G11-F43 TaxID=3424130 RepID=UPI003D34477C
MNDLDLMERFRAGTEPMSPAARARARAGMFAPEKPRPTGRWTWRLAPVGALAAAATIAAVTVSRPAEPAPTARSVLLLAAAEARRETALPARPDQFVYVESYIEYHSTITNADGSETIEPLVPKHREIWQSADGTRDGLLRQRPRDPGIPNPDPEMANSPISVCQGVEPGEACPVRPAYPRDLPADAAAMRAHLDRAYTGGQPADRGVFVAATDLLTEVYVPPAVQAAIFEALATVPGAQVQEGGTDLAGRPGIAVGHVLDGARYDLIFDAGDYHYLGKREVLVEAYRDVPAGTVNGQSARIRVAVVDRPGDRP